jgi:hypothetical protein
MTILIGNLIALVAAILMVYSGFLKKKPDILFVQTIQLGMSVLSNIILGGITGAIINAISCIRNILCYKNKFSIIYKIIIISIAIILSLLYNNLGLIGLLPLISFTAYGLLINIKDVIKFKILIIFTMVMWLIYDLNIKSYTSACFEILNIIANLTAIIQIKSRNKKDSLVKTSK